MSLVEAYTYIVLIMALMGVVGSSINYILRKV